MKFIIWKKNQLLFWIELKKFIALSFYMLRMRKKVKSFIPELKDAYEILIERINKKEIKE